jgi:hypothetical protein
VTTQHERLAQIAGTRKTIDIAALPQDLRIATAPKQRLGVGSYRHSGQAVTLTPDAVVVVRQGRVKAAVVADYLDSIQAGERLEDLAVTDRPGDGRWWHINGAHRLLAARLAGVNVQAGVWR